MYKNSTLTIQCSYLVVKMHHKYSMYEIINHDSGPQGLIICFTLTHCFYCSRKPYLFNSVFCLIPQSF